MCKYVCQWQEGSEINRVGHGFVQAEAAGWVTRPSRTWFACTFLIDCFASTELLGYQQQLILCWSRMKNIGSDVAGFLLRY